MIAGRAAALALRADWLADIAVLRAQPDLAGPVASGPVDDAHHGLAEAIGVTLPGAAWPHV